MIQRRSTRSLCLLFTALLLWAQVAVAEHNVDHLWHELTDVCQIMMSADHSKTVTAATEIIDADNRQLPIRVAAQSQYKPANRTSQHARSPPA